MELTEGPKPERYINENRIGKNPACFCLVLCMTFGEGNGTPLQYSSLENPMDRGAWKAAVMESLRVGDD